MSLILKPYEVLKLWAIIPSDVAQWVELLLGVYYLGYSYGYRMTITVPLPQILKQWWH